MTKPTQDVNVHYVSSAEEFKRRIIAEIPNHPAILDMESPWDLFKVKSLKSKDLGLTMFQASWALGRAKQEWKHGR